MFAVFDSGLLVETEAKFVNNVRLGTSGAVTTILNVALAFPAKVPSRANTVPPTLPQVPVEAEQETKVADPGRLSVTLTFWAGDPPVF